MAGDRYDDPLFDPEDDEAEYESGLLDGYIYDDDDEEDEDGDD